MKNFLKVTVPTLIVVAMTLSLAIAFAQKNNYETSLQFSINIPDQWNSLIVRNDEESIAVFAFQKRDGSRVFLFSLNRIPETIWLAVKGQLDHYKVLDHRNGNFYFVEYTDRPRIKGEDNALYQQIYEQIPDLINSIKIIE